MAYKVFSNGDALTGGELNTYLMNQSVMVFATTTARNAALPAPTEGMLVWLEDSNKYTYYSGTAWTDLIIPASSGNAIINGAFDIWQRGTSIANTGATAYGADRWALGGGALNASTISRQTASTTGARYGMRWGRNSGVTTATTHRMIQPLETANSLQFAGKTVTLSFNALRGANAPTSLTAVIYYGTGTDQAASDIWAGWTGGTAAVSTALTIGTSVGSFSVSAAIPSTATQIAVYFEYVSTGTAGAAEWFQVENVQLEAATVATSFKRNGDSIQGELAACQRYYYRVPGNLESVVSVSGSSVAVLVPYPVTMRTTPTSGQNITDASYSTNPGANQWGLVQAQVAWSTKSGTANQIALVGTQSNAFLQIGGATFSPTPNAIKIVSDRYLELIAEL